MLRVEMGSAKNISGVRRWLRSDILWGVTSFEERKAPGRERYPGEGGSQVKLRGHS
jgi:hypothetical protein